MIATLLSMMGGGLMRLLPELLNLVNKKTDNAHELNLLEKQSALEQTRGQARVAEVAVEGNVEEQIKQMDSLKAAVESQMQRTGISIVDALNFLVRPLTTYYFLGCYGIYKTAMLYAAFHQTDIWSAVIQSYDQDDRTILSGILSFWFVGRVFDKAK